MTAFVPTAGPTNLTREQARALVDEVKADAVSLAEKMLRLYEDGAHHALGYKSWSQFATAEFEELRSKSYAYRMLKAARVDRAFAESTIVDRPKNIAVADALGAVLDEGHEAVRETWGSVVQEHGPEPTAAQVKQTIHGAVGDTLNGSGAAHSVAVKARCPTCGGPFSAEVVEGRPQESEPEPVAEPGDSVPVWMQDPGPEPGWTPMLDDADLFGSGGDLAA